MSIKRTVAMSLSLVPLVVACTGGVPTPEPAPTAPQTAVQTPEGEPAWVVTNGVTWVRQFNEPEVELTGVEADSSGIYVTGWTEGYLRRFSGSRGIYRDAEEI